MTARKSLGWMGVMLVGLWVLASGCASSPETEPLASTQTAQLISAPTRPSGVPAEFVATPHGYMHPSCVIELRQDEQAHPSGGILRADGTVRSLARCAFPRYDHEGKAVGTGAAKTPTINGWVSQAQNTALGASGGLSGTWIVPGAPATVSGQIVYLFPGIEPLATGDTIMQPVLGWNHYGDGPRWAMASWNCCLNGNAIHSQIMPVSVGDTIHGVISGANCSAGVCANWTITTTDQTTGASSILQTTAYGEVMNWLFGGALEVYGVDQCSQLPTVAGVQFNTLSATVPGGGPTAPSWSPVIYAATTPSCSYGATSSGTSNVSLTWNPCAAGLQACGNACVNTSTDSSNCGACGQRCVGAARVCSNGVCGCPAGQHSCCGGDTCRTGACGLCP